jgi:tetratricopeptide (TPR) repeat protein
LGLGIVLGAFVVMGGAAALVYFGVLSKKGDEVEKPVAVVQADASVPVVTAALDASVPVEKDLDPKQVALAAAADAIFADTGSSLELALEGLEKLENVDADLDVQVSLGQLQVALTQQLVDNAAVMDKKEASAAKKEIRKRLKGLKKQAAKVRSLGPTDVRAMVVAAADLRLRGRSSREVERFLRKALTVQADNSEALFERGLLKIRERRIRDAREILKPLVDDSSKDTRARFRLAQLDFEESDYGSARAGAQGVLSLQPEHGRAQELLRRVEEAEKVATSDPLPPDEGGDDGSSDPSPEKPEETGGSYESLVKKANKAAESGSCGTATKLYERALDKNPAGVSALTGLGYCYLDKGQFASAQAKFRAALGVSPRYRDALYGVAEGYQQQGLNKQAIAAYERYLKVHPAGGRAVSARRQIQKLGGGAKPPPGGGDTPPPGGGGDTPPPGGGGDTPPAGGGDTPPAGGGDTPPAGGGDTPPAGGGDTPPADDKPADKPPPDPAPKPSDAPSPAPSGGDSE